MFNSIVLDTVIGLVFVFLLYSLLATILGELIANWLGLRARMLRQAIERLLNDGYNDDAAKEHLNPGIRSLIKWVDQIRRSLGSFFLYEFKEFDNSFAGRFYKQPSIKYLAKGSRKNITLFRKGKPSYIRSENFSDTLVQLLRGKGNGETEMQKIEFCLKFNTLHIQPETLGHLTNLFTDSGNDPEKFRQKLNDWYNEMMERLGGWFKRKIQLILFLLGLIIAFAFNVDSIAITKKLSKDKNAREQLVQMAIKASDSTSSISKAIQQSRDTTIKDSLMKESYRMVKQATDDAGKVLGLGWDFPKSATFFGKVCYMFKQSWSHKLMLLGFIITALAISLGSNFWFDLLKKLVSIRGSGVNPDETKTKKTGDSNADVTGIQPAKPSIEPEQKEIVPEKPVDNLAVAVNSAIAKFSTIPGIISIESGYIKVKNEKREAIEINIMNQEVRKKIKPLKNDTYLGFPVNFIVNTIASAQRINCGDTIYNENAINGIGTVGCFLTRIGSPKFYLLSCWHVLKGDKNWNSSSSANLNIMDKDKNLIAKVVDGCLTDRFDAGFAELLSNEKVDNTPLKVKFNWREVSATDAFNETPVSFIGATSGHQDAVIYKNIVGKKLDYPDGGTYNLVDLFSITTYDENGRFKSPSDKGDSGALVVDNSGYPLGLIIGGDDAFTYVAKFSNFLSNESIYREYRILI
jgi:hypothetical protein